MLLALVVLSCCSKPSSVSDEEEQGGKTPSAKHADLLDLTLASSAAGSDFSAHRCGVVTNSGFTLSAYYHDYYKRFVGVFSGTPGKTVGSGYYRIDYSSDAVFREKLADGFSMEAVFSAGALPSGSADACVFSSVQDSGFGIGVSSGSSGNHIRFEINTGKLLNLDSGITPESGIFYHVLAVWDRDSGKARLFVDGVLKAESSTGESLLLPSDAASAWLCIGGDCSSSVNYAERSWQGEVAMARIWDKPMDASEVRSLYEKVKNSSQAASSIKLSELAFLTSCSVGAGYRYNVYAGGVAFGDVLVLRSGSREIECPTSYSVGMLSATVPSELVSGTWTLLLRRGSEYKVLGSVAFSVSANPPLPQLTKVFAHRCVHNNSSGPYENSLEALKKTQTYGVYGAEFDVWITKDGYVVVHHDASIGGYKIETSNWSQIKDVKLGCGEHLPLLSEFLDQGLKAPETVLNFEIKKHSSAARNQACAEAVAVLLKERNMVSQCRVMSYSTDALDRLHSLVPTLPVDYIGTDDPSFAIGKGYSGIEVNMNTLSANPDWVVRCHNAGLKVCTWTPSTVADLMTFVNMGVDYMTVDNVNNVDLAKSVTGRQYVGF